MSITKNRKPEYTVSIVTTRSQNGIRALSFVWIAKCSKLLPSIYADVQKITCCRKVIIINRIPYSTVDSAQFSSYTPFWYSVYLRHFYLTSVNCTSETTVPRWDVPRLEVLRLQVLRLQVLRFQVLRLQVLRLQVLKSSLSYPLLLRGWDGKGAEASAQRTNARMLQATTSHYFIVMHAENYFY
jgi:hypothetical protein